MFRMHGHKMLREVWTGNLQHEFSLFSQCLRSAAVVAIDTEFPGVIQENAWKESEETHYRAMKESVEFLPLIQIGLAVASSDGQCLGVWNFNLNYNLATDFHTDAAVNFLRACGVDFDRHASEGIDAISLGAMLKSSGLSSCAWVTFAGMTDLLYLMQLVHPEHELPQTLGGFQSLLEETCATRQELRDRMPFGSLSTLARSHGVIRHGQAHTAGSDALVTLELFFRSRDETAEPGTFGPNGSAAAVHLNPEFGRSHHPLQAAMEPRLASAC